MGVAFPREVEESAELLSVESFDNGFVGSPDSLCASMARAGFGSEIILTAGMTVHLAFWLEISARNNDWSRTGLTRNQARLESRDRVARQNGHRRPRLFPHQAAGSTCR